MCPMRKPTRVSPLVGVRVCPYCSSVEVRRSGRRGLYERLILRMLFLCPYRCEKCGRRYYGSTSVKRISRL